MSLNDFKRTKIIATLGPACDAPNIMSALIAAGTDLVRINYSHGEDMIRQKRVVMARAAAQAQNREIGVLADLQGPKIRIAAFKQGKTELFLNQIFTLDASLDDNAGDNKQVGIDYKQLIHDVIVGDRLLLDDGKIELFVVELSGPRIVCKVICGGTLSDRKGINKVNGGLSAGAITDKDRQDIKSAVQLGADYCAVSFVRTADDIHFARQLIREAGGNMGIIAKIERREALDHIDSIIEASDAVMVARGDLAVEIGDARVPSAQKHIIQRARHLNKAVITATQMMESMIESPVPTRAEVSDVANAVIDGTDAVMLSAETATGKHPVAVVESMARVCREAEKNPLTVRSRHRVENVFHKIDEAIAMATMYVANHLHIKAIVALTESGSTTLWMSRIRSGIPIYGLSRSLNSRRRMTLYRGVYPIAFDPTVIDRREINRKATDTVLKLGYVNQGDLVIVTKGNLMGELGGTNALKIVTIGEPM